MAFAFKTKYEDIPKANYHDMTGVCYLNLKLGILSKAQHFIVSVKSDFTYKFPKVWKCYMKSFPQKPKKFYEVKLDFFFQMPNLKESLH